LSLLLPCCALLHGMVVSITIEIAAFIASDLATSITHEFEGHKRIAASALKRCRPAEPMRYWLHHTT